MLSTPIPEEYRHSIGIRHASFTWANDSTKLAVTPGGTRRRMFMLHVDEDLFFKRGKINLIIGPTGAGKTSLLMALLGEMHYIPQGPTSFVNLPRTGGAWRMLRKSRGCRMRLSRCVFPISGDVFTVILLWLFF